MADSRRFFILIEIKYCSGNAEKKLGEISKYAQMIRYGLVPHPSSFLPHPSPLTPPPAFFIKVTKKHDYVTFLTFF